MLSWLSVHSQRCSFPPGGCWPRRASLHLSYPSPPTASTSGCACARPCRCTFLKHCRCSHQHYSHSTASLGTAGRQHSFLNASQASSRWCLSLKANKCFGALIYLRKHHLSYQGQEALLETPFLVDLHSLITSSKHREFTLHRMYITNGLFRFAQMHLKHN